MGRGFARRGGSDTVLGRVVSIAFYLTGAKPGLGQKACTFMGFGKSGITGPECGP